MYSRCQSVGRWCSWACAEVAGHRLYSTSDNRDFLIVNAGGPVAFWGRSHWSSKCPPRADGPNNTRSRKRDSVHSTAASRRCTARIRMPTPGGAKGSGQGLVWVRAYGKEAIKSPYVAARKTGTGNGKIQVTPEGGGAPSYVAETDLIARNPPGSRPDNCQLLHLNEACVLENVAARYMASEIYTWTSHVLTAVNPYEPLALYSDHMAAMLPSMAPRDLPPHAFSVAELAVRNVVRGSQAVIVSGESGAGKTFNMAHVMAYLTRRARNGGAADNGLGVRLGTLLLQSNPVLEAFGNAQTVRNHNSSRFGKFVKVAFDASGTKMVTMTLKTYLLEKVRVVSPAACERTFHVFYALLAGASPKDRARWGLRSQPEHALTANASDSDAAAAEGNEGKYIALGDALTCLTVRSEEQTDLLGLVSAILHLRDVRFVPLDDADGGCRAVGTAALSHAVKLLGCPGIAMRLVQRVILTGREAEPVTVSLSPSQASAARDALCKAVYVALFEHIGRRFNEAAAAIGSQIRTAEEKAKKSTMKSPPVSGARRRMIDDDEDPQYSNNYPATAASSVDGGPFIGLLDMFGFEIFEVNSLEQLCINLANERLQGYFQQCVFTAEEEVHRLEGVPWPADLEYLDNSGCIALITSSIFVLLDEACSLQNGSESAFFTRVAETCGRDPFFGTARRKRLREDEGFMVRHFAGDVCYCSAHAASDSSIDRNGGGSGARSQAHVQASADTWLVKNADRLLPELASELRGSTSPLVATLFVREHGESRRSKTSVVRRFCTDLDSLLVDLQQTYSRFLRCIKPNNMASPKVFDRASVLAQLRCLGMTDVVRLMHQAFPTRIPYTLLHGRYAKGMPPVLAKLPPRDFCEAVALVCEVSKNDMHLGTTRLFMRGGKGDFLEDLAEMDLAEAMPLLIKKIESMNNRRKAGKVVACAVRTHYLRSRYLRRKTACALIVRIWRGALARTKTREQRLKLRDLRVSTPVAKNVRSSTVSKEAADQMAMDFDSQMAAYGHITDTRGSAEATGLSPPKDRAPAPPSRTNTSQLADHTLYSSLGVRPLGAAQFRAVHALRQRLGEHLAENTTVAGGDEQPRRPMRAPGADASAPQLDLPAIPARRRLNAPGQTEKNESKKASSSSQGSLPPGLPPWVEQGDRAGKGTKLEVALSRDARDGTLGIDLDQFTGKPTVAVVVPGGPAERDGTVRPGDIILAVDGVACSSIGEVIAVLSSPSASVKNPLSVQLLRKQKFAVADDLLLVRALPTSAAVDGLAGLANEPSASGKYGNAKSGGLQHLTDWTRCRCALMSDRRLCVTEPNMKVDAAFDLRATQSVQLILTPFDRGARTDATRRSCLQVRTPDGIIEFCAPNPSSGEPSLLLAWQRPLEDMLMISLSSSLKGWLHYLTPSEEDPATAMTAGSRVFLDLNGHSQLRTIVDRPEANRGAHMGVIELVELQKIELVELQTPPDGHVKLAGTTNALSISTAEAACMLAFEEPMRAAQWAKELEVAHKAALVALVQYTGMILIDGWLEYQGDEDEWASGFFILTIGNGLQCFEDAVSEPTLADAIETLPLEQITGAVRSKGIDYYDWCVDVRTTDGDYIRVRPPRQAEMTRWLATINLYCTPPQKKKPERPRRRQTQNSSERPGEGTSPGLAKGQMHAARPRNPGDARVDVRPGYGMSTGLDGPATQMAWGGAGAAMESEGLPSPKRRSVPVPAQGPDHQPGQYPGLVSGWQAAPDTVPEPEPAKLARAASFGRRRTMSFSRRGRSNTTAIEVPVEVPEPVGPSRGGRLRSAKPTAEATEGAPAEGSMSSKLTKRRPSFSRRRGMKTESNPLETSISSAELLRPDPKTLQPLEVSLPGERQRQGGQKIKSRASSFTRVRHKPSVESMSSVPAISAPAPPRNMPQPVLPSVPPSSVVTPLLERAATAAPSAILHPPSAAAPTAEKPASKIKRASSFSRASARVKNAFKGRASSEKYTDA